MKAFEVQAFPVRVRYDKAKEKWVKVPAVPKGEHWKDHTFDTGNLWEHDNYGLIIPDGVVVIDIDTHKGASTDAIDRSLDWEAAFLQNTPSGGAHYGFRLPTGCTVRQGSDLLGIKGFDTRTAGKGWIASGDGYDGRAFELLGGERASLPELAVQLCELLGEGAAPVDAADCSDDGLLEAVVAQPDDRITMEMLTALVKRIPASCAESIDSWRDVGMAIAHQTEGSEEGWKLFDKWSKRSPDNYDAAGNRAQWDNFVARSGKTSNPIRVGTLAHYAGTTISDFIRREVVAEVHTEAQQNDAQAAIARTLADDITSRLNALFGRELPELDINQDVIRNIINSSVWSASKSQLFMLNCNGETTRFGNADMFKHLQKEFGQSVDQDILSALIAEHVETITNQAARTAFERDVRKVAHNVIVDHIKHYNQRETINYRVDMFAKDHTLSMTERAAKVVLPHRKFPQLGTRNDAVVADYKQHFPRLDEMLEFVVASRFASDRKKSYLWMLASSDWGKTFLMSAFKDLGLCVELSVGEIESIMEGKPVGRSPEDFRRAFVLLVEEFKGVKSELKQLQNDITLSPKHQLSANVEIFAKVFLSAETVSSLITDVGVEDQFANRISMFNETGSIEDRPMFNSASGPGKAAYYDAVLHYVAQQMNKLVGAMQDMGRKDAQRKADDFLTRFQRDHGISNTHARIGDNIQDIADDVIRYVTELDTGFKNTNWVRYDKGEWYLQSPARVIDDYIRNNVSESSQVTLKRRKADIKRMICADTDSEPKAVRVDGVVTRSIRLRKLSE